MRYGHDTEDARDEMLEEERQLRIETEDIMHSMLTRARVLNAAKDDDRDELDGMMASTEFQMLDDDNLLLTPAIFMGVIPVKMWRDAGLEPVIREVKFMLAFTSQKELALYAAFFKRTYLEWPSRRASELKADADRRVMDGLLPQWLEEGVEYMLINAFGSEPVVVGIQDIIDHTSGFAGNGWDD